MAVAANEMDPVELAYSRRPVSPSYRIYTDQEVNGQLKETDYIAPKYTDGLILCDVQSPRSGGHKIASTSG